VSALAIPLGTAAPNFKGTDSTGTQQTLSQYRGKFVVLEWANKGCPYDRKHYISGNMEALQKEWTAKDVVWLSVISSAPGEQGYVTPAEENDYLKKMHAAPTAAILDPTGTIGRLYEAKTTPTSSSSTQQENLSTKVRSTTSQPLNYRTSKVPTTTSTKP
jgi:AhpC/TSA family